MRRSFVPLALCSALAVAPACSYLEGRVRDLSQTVHVGVGVSLVPGLFVYACAPLFGTAFGYLHESTYVGSDYGYAFAWHQAGAGTLLGGEFVRAQLGHDVAGFTRGDNPALYLDQSQLFMISLAVQDYRTSRSPTAITLGRVDVGAHLLFVGASLGLDFVELFDFVTSTFGWDVLDDDEFVPRRWPFELPGDALLDTPANVPAG
ncbi:MAG: hypothetical protein H6825_12665 [Planctomycetes bacterium]|nr:hypothetical protein [Planctomycetota bacterium]